jgi:hypothetical protein
MRHIASPPREGSSKLAESTVSLWISSPFSSASLSSLKQVWIVAVMSAGRTTLLMKAQTLFGCVSFFKRFLSNLSSLPGCCSYKLIIAR